VAEVNRHRKRLQAQGIDTIAKSAAGTLMRRGDHSGERGETRWLLLSPTLRLRAF